jgi:serine/threonine-protein kinase
LVELRILGSPDLIGSDGGKVLSVVSRPKPLALLSYMAVECVGTYRRRDRLLGLFWPETEERKARSSLSEALSRLRQALGPDVIITRGKEEIALNPSEFWADANALLTAADDSDVLEIARLYRGPLLDGFFLDELRGFDHWLDSTRSRMERIALEALGALADASEASGDESAMTWAERAVALSPSDGPSMRRFMLLQARSGHRAGALDAFDRFQRRLMDERGIDPSTELVELAERIKAGELFKAPEPREASPSRLDSLDAATARDLEDSEDVAGVPDGALVPRRAVDAPRRGLVVAGTVLAITAVAAWTFVPRPPEPGIQVEVTPPAGSQLLDRYGAVGFALSPDDRRLVYVGQASGSDGRQLWERRLEDLEPTPIPRTQGARGPVFSPNGTTLLFWQDNSLKTLRLTGGQPITLVADVGDEPYMDWAADGLIYYSAGGRIHRVAASGGPPEPVTTLWEGASTRLPDALPDGRGLLVTLNKTYPESTIGVVGPEGGDIRELFPGTTARYAEPGHIVYVTLDGTLMQVPFDVVRLEVTGDPVALLQGIAVSTDNPADQQRRSAAQWAVSSTGTVVYRMAPTPESYQAVWVDRRGRATEVDPDWTFAGGSRFSSLALSPDQDRLAISYAGPTGSSLWIKHLDEGPVERFTFDAQHNSRVSWSPDGEFLIWVREPSEMEWGLARKRSDGTGEIETLVSGSVGLAAYSPDGEWLVHTLEADGPGRSDILVQRVGVDTVSRGLLEGEYAEFSPALSPNGRWLAYSSNESGQLETYVNSFPDVERVKKQVSTAGGFEPMWSNSGRELFFRNGEQELVAVDVEDEPTFSAGVERVLFSAAGFLDGGRSHPVYDVRADDQAFMMLRAVSGDPGKLILVERLLADLSR